MGLGVRKQVRPFRHSSDQLSLGVRDERRPLAERPQPEHGVHDLNLPTAPATTGIDVEGKHGQGICDL